MNRKRDILYSVVGALAAVSLGVLGIWLIKNHNAITVIALAILGAFSLFALLVSAIYGYIRLVRKYK